MKLIFSEVEPAQIPGLWVHLKPGIDEYLKRFSQHINWTGKDVLEALKKDTARTIFLYQGGERIGFMVVRGFREEFNANSKYMHLWLGYLDKDHRGNIREYLPQAFDYLAKLASKSGAKYIEMDTPRQGWGRLMPDVGMTPNRTVYRKEI